MPKPQKKPITVRLDPKTVRALDMLARTVDRDRSYLLGEAVENYIDLQEYHAELIREGLKQANRRELMDHEEVNTLIRRWTRSK